MPRRRPRPSPPADLPESGMLPPRAVPRARNPRWEPGMGMIPDPRQIGDGGGDGSTYLSASNAARKVRTSKAREKRRLRCSRTRQSE